MDRCWIPVCECDTSLVSCFNKNLSKIPALVPDTNYGSVSLNFDRNMIARIPGRVFEKVGRFVYGDIILSLQSNRIYDINVDAFVGIEGKVTVINLSNNTLTYLPAAIRTLSRLEDLDLTKNMLQSLDGGILSNIGKSLKYLALGMKSILTISTELTNLKNLTTLRLEEMGAIDIDKNAFSGQALTLIQLEIYYSFLDGMPEAVCQLTKPINFIFYYNNITTLNNISAVCSLPSVGYFDLYNSSITAIYDDDLSGFLNLTSLSLNNNPLRYISSGAFKNNLYLSTLYLSGTELHYLPVAITVPPRLTDVILSGPYNCSCATMSGLRAWSQRAADQWPLAGGFCDGLYISLQEYFIKELPKCP